MLMAIEARGGFMNNRNEYNGFFNNVYIPEKFAVNILQHILLNSVKIEQYHPAPILAIQGRMGEGKTYMTENLLIAKGIKYKLISGSILAGSNEGAGVDVFDFYYDDVRASIENGWYGVLVIDDFHLSTAATLSNAGHTTNAENLVGHLMNIADRQNGIIVPMILIGNDFTKLYPPLMRAGRMNIFDWEPRFDDKLIIVRQLLRERGFDQRVCSDKQILEFVQKYSNQYLAFFSQSIEKVYIDKFNNIVYSFMNSKEYFPKEWLYKGIAEAFDNSGPVFSELLEAAEAILGRQPKKYDTK